MKTSISITKKPALQGDFYPEAFFATEPRAQKSILKNDRFRTHLFLTGCKTFGMISGMVIIYIRGPRMRTIIDIPDNQIKALNHYAQQQKVSRAEIIRHALAKYITKQNKKNKAYTKAFGIWSKSNLDSLQYQNKLREEWD